MARRLFLVSLTGGLASSCFFPPAGRLGQQAASQRWAAVARLLQQGIPGCGQLVSGKPEVISHALRLQMAQGTNVAYPG